MAVTVLGLTGASQGGPFGAYAGKTEAVAFDNIVAGDGLIAQTVAGDALIAQTASGDGLLAQTVSGDVTI